MKFFKKKEDSFWKDVDFQRKIEGREDSHIQVQKPPVRVGSITLNL